MSPQLQHELGAALAAVLDEMRQAVDELAHVLDAERAALDGVDSAALDQAGTRKQALMLQLEQLDAERHQLAREQPAADAALEPAWAGIVQSLRHCQQLNQRNGNAVNQRLQLMRRALAILSGQDGGNGLYDRAGELHAGLRSRALAAA